MTRTSKLGRAATTMLHLRKTADGGNAGPARHGRSGRRRTISTSPRGLAMIALLLGGWTAAGTGLRADPVRVQQTEGVTHGYLTLRDAVGGPLLATGELLETVRGDRGKVHLLFHFRDGSVDDETTVFSQRGVFRVESDHHVQKGPSFPHATDMRVDGRSGTVTVRTEDSGKSKDDVYHMDLQPDLANGIIPILLKNVNGAEGETKVSMVAASPKPRLVTLAITRGGEEAFEAAGARFRAIRYDVKVELGGVVGLIAPMMGQEPKLNHVWVTKGQAPAVVRIDAQMYVGGPLWRLELVSPVWH